MQTNWDICHHFWCCVVFDHFLQFDFVALHCFPSNVVFRVVVLFSFIALGLCSCCIDFLIWLFSIDFVTQQQTTIMKNRPTVTNRQQTTILMENNDNNKQKRTKKKCSKKQYSCNKQQKQWFRLNGNTINIEFGNSNNCNNMHKQSSATLLWTTKKKTKWQQN